MTSIAIAAAALMAGLTGVPASQPGAANGNDQRPRVRISASYAAQRCHEKIAEVFNRTRGYEAAVVDGCTNGEGVMALVRGKCDVLMHSGPLNKMETQLLAHWFRDPTRQPVPFVFGRYGVTVIVNKANPVKGLTLEQFGKIFGGKAKSWYDVGVDYQPGQPIVRCLQPVESNTNCIVRQKGLTGGGFVAGIKYGKNAHQTIETVAGNPTAIGVFLQHDIPLERVKVVGFRPTAADDGKLPSVETVFDADYPLVGELTLYLHPAASELAREYCEFACGKVGGDIAKQFLLYPVHDYKRVLAARRLAELKQGKGEQILAVGTKEVAKLAEELNIEYVITNSPVRVTFAESSQPAAVAALIAARESSEPGTEIALMEGALTVDTMRIQGAAWQQLDHQDYWLGSRGTAIIVHSLNKLDSLTTDQVKAVFSGKVDDWRVLDASQSSLPIRRFGSAKFDPATKLFCEKILSAAECRRLDQKEKASQVIATVGADTQAIGFVNYCDVRAYFRGLNEQARDAQREGGLTMRLESVVPAIKVLAIGPGGSAVAPSSATINDGTYPLSAPLMLYVSPNAREVAKKFAEFCVCRAAKPVLEKYGYVPAPQSVTLKPFLAKAVTAAADQPATVPPGLPATQPAEPLDVSPVGADGGGR